MLAAAAETESLIRPVKDRMKEHRSLPERNSASRGMRGRTRKIDSARPQQLAAAIIESLCDEGRLSEWDARWQTGDELWLCGGCALAR